MRSLLTFLLILFFSTALAVELKGNAVQGGLIFGQAKPESDILLDDEAIDISATGRFVVGFGRDETGSRKLQVTSPDGEVYLQTIHVKTRDYKIERVDGLPPASVNPDPGAMARIHEDASMVTTARAYRDKHAYYSNGFTWPARGRISGVYGSQRILNGEPRRPHFGLDIAAPEGAAVYAPADGLITLAHPDLYFSGGTIILDHGQGLSSSFLHLSKILVEAGTFVRQGDLIARVGATGRASGPHLDWRMNWRGRRVNPQPLVQPEEAAGNQLLE